MYLYWSVTKQDHAQVRWMGCHRDPVSGALMLSKAGLCPAQACGLNHAIQHAQHDATSECMST
eukprot:2165028-Amphidinium_carterae.2